MARGSGTVTVKFLGDTSGLKKASDDAEGALGKVGSAVGGMAKTAAMVGIPALVGFGAAAVKAFAESEQVAAQTEAVIKSTGGAAKVTAGHVGELAGSLSKMSGVDDEAIQSGENLLLTFTNIKNGAGKNNDIFDQTTGIMLDMAAAMGTDAKSQAIQLGKALNDPIAGVGALSRVGVTFTDQQKAQIKTLVESGKTMEAQKIILKELQTEFGGSAKAAGDTFAGQLGKLKVQLGNVMEEVGARLVPVLMRVGEILGTVIPAAINTVAPIFNALKDGITVLIAGFRDPNAPWEEGSPFIIGMGKVGGFIAKAVGWVSDLVDKFRDGGVSLGETGDQIGGMLTQLGDTFSSAFGAIKAIVVTAIDFLKGVWRVFGDDIMSFARESWAATVETIRGALEVVKGIFDLIKAVLTGKWGDAWDALKAIVDGVWDTIFGVVRNAVTNVIPTILAGLGQAVTSIGRTAFDGLKAPFIDTINWIIDKWNDFKIPGVEVLGHQVTPEINFPNLSHLARGGVFSGAAVVGEAGPELLVGAGRVIPNNQLGGGVTLIVNGWVGDEVSLIRKLKDALARDTRLGGTATT